MPLILKIKNPLSIKTFGRSSNLVNDVFGQSIKPAGDKTLPTDSPGTGVSTQFKHPIYRNPTTSAGTANTPTSLVMDAGVGVSADGVVNALKTDGVKIMLGRGGAGGNEPQICGIDQHWPLAQRFADDHIATRDPPTSDNASVHILQDLVDYNAWDPPRTSFCGLFERQEVDSGYPFYFTDGKGTGPSIDDSNQPVDGCIFMNSGIRDFRAETSEGGGRVSISTGRRESYDRTIGDPLVSGFSSFARGIRFFNHDDLASVSDMCFIFRMFQFNPVEYIKWELRIYPVVELVTMQKSAANIAPDTGLGIFTCYAFYFEDPSNNTLSSFPAYKVQVADTQGVKEPSTKERLVQFVAQDTQLDMATFRVTGSAIGSVIVPDDYFSSRIDRTTLHFPVFAFLGYEQMCFMIPYSSEMKHLHCGYQGQFASSPFWFYRTTRDRIVPAPEDMTSFPPGVGYTCGSPYLPRAIFEVRARYKFVGDDQENEQVFRLRHSVQQGAGT